MKKKVHETGELSGKIQQFVQELRKEERSDGTIEKYVRDVEQFAEWVDERPMTKELILLWKEELKSRYCPVTVNGKLASINRFLEISGMMEWRVKALKIQRRIFRDQRKELTKEEYERLVTEAREQGKERLALLMETICATGIRVSELSYVTMEAVRTGKAEISLKGKIRVILLPGKLCRKLSKYGKKYGINAGQLFVTRNGTPVSRKQIWAEMKRLCREAGIEASKVFPHNLRHLFARCFYKACRDVVRLADILGHSSVDTTRVYLISSGLEHERTLEGLHLIL